MADTVRTIRTPTGRTPSSPKTRNIPTWPPTPRCLTCYAKLRHPTSVPKPIFSRTTHPDIAEKEAATIKALQERKERERAEGYLGLNGDGQFCSGKCAEFYGRAAADLIGLSPINALFGRARGATTDWGRALMEQLDKSAGKFQWVAEARKRRGPK